MLKYMRTTVNLPDALILEARKVALESGTALTAIIASALREFLSKSSRKAPRKKFKIITSGKDGVFPGVDLSNTAALLDIMDGLDDPRRR